MPAMNLVICLLFFSICLRLDLVWLRREKKGGGNASKQVYMLLNRWHAGNSPNNLFNVKLCLYFQRVVWIGVIFFPILSVGVELL